MPAHPRKIKRFGWRRDIPDQRDHISKLPSIRQPLPPQLVLTHPLPSFDQGELGSCTANATVGAITFDQPLQSLPSVMESRLFLYYYSRLLEGMPEADSGASLRDVMKAYNQYGICAESDWPYDITKFAVSPDVQGDCKPIHYAYVEQNSFSIKRTIMSGFPVIFGFTVYNNFESSEVADSGILDLPNTDTDYPVGGHAVLMMGYDDNMTFPSGSKGGVYVRNSWGTSWGQSGYFWMPTDYITNPGLADDFWVIDKLSTPSGALQL